MVFAIPFNFTNCYAFRDLKGENNAKEISEALPFVEYEVHRQLINKLKMKGKVVLYHLDICICKI